MYLPSAIGGLRLIWLTRNALDPLQIQLIAARSASNCELHVLDQTRKSLWTANAIVRTGSLKPTMIVLEQPLGEPSLIDISGIRGRWSLRTLPIVVLGDPKDADAEQRAYGCGADKFFTLPTNAPGLMRLSADLAQFWRRPEPPEGTEGFARGA